MGMCNNCKEICLVVENGERVFPHPLPTPTDDRIPENLKIDLDEAKICFSVGAYRGCAVLARRAIQSCCIVSRTIFAYSLCNFRNSKRKD
jgi:hypothetical protein